MAHGSITYRSFSTEPACGLPQSLVEPSADLDKGPDATEDACFVVTHAPVDSMPRYPNMSPGGLLRALDYVGTVAFAHSGCVTAGHMGMDLMGCLLVGTITSVGGGTFRDVLIGNTPVFWMEETEYLMLCLLTGLVTFFLGLRSQHILSDEWLFWADTIGVAAFCIVGAQNGLRRRRSAFVCALCGMFTATFGGLVRDVLCRQPVRILHAHAELYATTALLGAAAYVAAQRREMPLLHRIALGLLTSGGLRFAAKTWDLKLPVYGPHAPAIDVAQAHLTVVGR